MARTMAGLGGSRHHKRPRPQPREARDDCQIAPSLPTRESGWQAGIGYWNVTGAPITYQSDFRSAYS